MCGIDIGIIIVIDSICDIDMTVFIIDDTTI